MKKISIFIGMILILGSTHIVAEGSHKISGHALNSDKLLELEPEYHTYSEVVSELFQIESEHSTIADVFLLGKSYENRDILGIKISDNVSTDEDKPEAFICALHHAREAATVEVAMYIINYVTDNYGKPGYEYVTYLVDNREIYIVPMVNPDGKVYDDFGGSYGEGLYWRKNRQPSTEGIGTDLNRNYSYHWGGPGSSPCVHSTFFGGDTPFDAPETRAVQTFILQHPDITVFLDYHSHGRMVLYPWGYTADPVTDLDDRQVHEIIGTQYARITGYKPMQISDLYCCSGSSVDWSYGTTQHDGTPIFSWGIELGGGEFYPLPSVLPVMCEKNCEAALYVIECADDPYKVLRQWKVLDVTDGADPVDRRGNTWYDTQYDDSHWYTTTLPDNTGGQHCDRFYRHTFTSYYETQQVLIECKSNNCSAIYVNGHVAGQWETHEGISTPLYDTSELEDFIDITPYVTVGKNVVAVYVKNSPEHRFDMRVIQSTEMYDDKQWKASTPTVDCNGPVDTRGNTWHDTAYDDSHWDTLTLPDFNTWGCTHCDRFYRRHFAVPAYTQVLIDFASDDGITVYVNGHVVGQWGDCHEEGCINAQCSARIQVDPVDITPYTTEGENVIAVHITNSWALSLFDMTITRRKVLPDLCITNQDISFSDPHPAPGDVITIHAALHTTDVVLPSTFLRFYDGNPKKDGTLISEFPVSVSTPLLHTTWTYPGGVHHIYVVVDEDNTIVEPHREMNNTGLATVPVPDFCSWPMFRHYPCRSGVSQVRGDIKTVFEKWRFSTSGPVQSSPSVEDIDNDGKMEVVFGSCDCKIYAVNHDGRLQWVYQTKDHVLSSPAIRDVDNDGEMEVICGSDDGHVYCLDGEDGKLLWKYSTGSAVSSPAVCDVDSDGEMEIFVGSHDGTVYALCGEDGAVLWQFCTPGAIGSSPALADLNGDGQLDVVIGSHNHVYALDALEGWIVMKVKGCDDTFTSSPAVGDINGDGAPEIVIGSDTTVYVITRKGKVLWTVPADGNYHSSPALADIDQNGDIEVIIGSENKVCAFNGEDGSILWEVETQGLILSSPAVADIDGDGDYDAVVGSNDTFLYAVDGSGTVLWIFGTGAAIESSPAVADIDDDGFAEIVVGSNDSRVYVLDSDVSATYWVRIAGILGGFLLGILLLGFIVLKKTL